MHAPRAIFLFSALLISSASFPRLNAQTASPPLVFDVASIHVNNTANDGHHHIYNNPSESHFRAVNLAIRDLIQFAYDLPKSQITGGPAWLDSTMFDVDAKADSSVDSMLRASPSDQARQKKQEMVKALLVDRFKLKVHEETRELPIYTLVVAKGGSKIMPSQVNGTTIDPRRSQLHVAGSDDTIALLSRQLAELLGRVVVNETGLAGRYDITLRWTPDDGPAPLLNGAPDPSAPPGLFAAIQEQLGLALKSARGPVPILVVDSADLPTAN